METINTLKPKFVLYYEKHNITNDISDSYTQITYTDNEHGKADDISIELADTTDKWKNAWYPQKADRLTLFIGYEGKKLLPCGTFEIDEMNFKYKSISIKGIGASIKKNLRELNTRGYSNTTLKKIVHAVAAKHDLKPVGTIQNIRIGRINQNKESDLTFLRNLAERYGYDFKVTSDSLVFFSIDELEKGKSVLTFSPENLLDYSFTDKTDRTYKACTVSYYNPKTGKVVKTTYRSDKSVKGDVLKLDTRCESKQQAIATAKAALHRSLHPIEGSIEIEGNPAICSGVVITIKGLGKLDGRYLVVTCTHSISKSGGYKTSAEVRKIA